MQGRSILPLVKGQDYEWPGEVFVQISESQVGRAIRSKRWKYAVAAPDKDGWKDSCSDSYIEAELYDLMADPDELRNLAGQEDASRALRCAARAPDQAHDPGRGKTSRSLSRRRCNRVSAGN